MPQDDRPDRLYVGDRIERDAPVADAAGLRATLARGSALVYICGIGGMELGVFQAMRRALPGDAIAPYLTVAPEVEADPSAWTRRMINRQIRVTKRVMLEVY